MKKVTLLIKGNLKSLGRIAPAREGGADFYATFLTIS